MMIINVKFKIFFVAAMFYAFLFFSHSVQAADFYVAQIAQGSDTGVDCTNAYSASWFNTATNWANPKQDGKIGPGDTVHLCGVISTALIVGGHGSAENEIKILFENNAKLSSPCFEGSFGNHTGGAILVHTKDYIIIDGGTNGIIENTDAGSQASFTYHRDGTANIIGTIGVHLYHSNNVHVQNLTINNLYQSTSNEQPNNTATYGILIFASDNVHVTHNTVSYVADAIAFFSYSNAHIEINNNTTNRMGVGVLAAVGADGYTADDILIHHNTISDTTDWSYNDGIKIFARPATTDVMTGLKIYGNIIGPKISYSSTGHPATACILCDQGWIIAPEIYNNLCILDANDNVGNGMITVGGINNGNFGLLAQNSKIYNNTLISSFPSGEIGILVTKWTTGHQIYNNVIKLLGNSTGIMVNDHYTTIAASNYNIFYTTGTLQMNYGGWEVDHRYTWSAWRSTFNLDEFSEIVDPGISTDGSASSVLSRVVTMGGQDVSTTLSTDLIGISRPQGSGWDIGAYEFVESAPDTTPPSAPLNLAVQ